MDPALIYPILFSVNDDRQDALAAVWSRLRMFDSNIVPSISLWNVEAMLLNPQRTLAHALAMLAAILAILALSLTGIGIYGAMSYVVSQRTREIGVRIALGATPGCILRINGVEGLRPVVMGIVAGIAAGAALSMVRHRTLAFPGSIDLLYGVSFYDPFTFFVITFFLITISLAASLGPALETIAVDPLVAMHYE